MDDGSGNEPKPNDPSGGRLGTRVKMDSGRKVGSDYEPNSSRSGQKLPKKDSRGENLGRGLE
jgi:hypothetical protein